MAQRTRYRLDDQAGYLLRLASQRHTAIFAALMEHGLTPTQFACLVRLAEVGPTSQNHLGRLTAMDAATVKGVVDRLKARGLVVVAPDAADARRRVIRLSDQARAMLPRLTDCARRITEATLAPLDEAERRTLLALLRKLG